MDIRKIIREEMDGFDWAKETDFLSKEYLLGKGIEFSPPMDGDEIEYFEYVLKTLKDIGFRVSFNVDEYISEMVDDYEEVTGLYINPGGGVIITGMIWDETYQEHINEYVSGGGYRSEGHVDVVQGREIFHMSMNESMEWAQEINPTPYNGVKFISVILREKILFIPLQIMVDLMLLYLGIMVMPMERLVEVKLRNISVKVIGLLFKFCFMWIIIK
jgi:hypothetical protein